MTKQNLIILFFPVFLFSCSDQEGKPAETISATSGETGLINEIKKFPDSFLLKETLIQYYRDSGSFDKAIAVADDAIQKDSNNARLWDIKATLHFENTDTVNAIRAFERAVSIVPDPGYIMSLGSLYAQTRNARALEVADRLLINQAANAAKEAFFIKGIYYTYSGDKNKAISYFDKCLALEYTFMFAYREKAIALYDLGKYEEAIKVLDKAVTLQNNFDEGYYWLGRCLEKLGKPKEAMEEYHKALMYSPDFIEAKEALTRLGSN